MPSGEMATEAPLRRTYSSAFVDLASWLAQLGLDLTSASNVAFVAAVAPFAVDDPDFERATYALVLLDDGCRAFLRGSSVLRDPSVVLSPEFQTAATAVLDYSVGYLRASERFIFGERTGWPRRIWRRVWAWLRPKDYSYLVWTPAKEWEIRPTPWPPPSVKARLEAATREQSRQPQGASPPPAGA